MAEDQNIINQFNASRKIKNPSTLCYAADISLNFEQTGHVTACCFNRSYVLGKWPEESIMDIWTGKKVKALRMALQNNSLALGCEQCRVMLHDGNFESALISQFDNYIPRVNGMVAETSGEFYMPTLFEFELSNTCNLECIMCGGKWSSAIRKNREKLPSLKSPYDDRFVGQVRECIPMLKRANFLGGEPFLISIYYDIWEDIVELNPSMEVAITSNGTTLNKRAKRIIEGLDNVKLTLSIDSLDKSTYEIIRRNADFDLVRENIDYLLQTGKLVSFSVCPMIQNRMEIPSIIEFCEHHGIDIFFNVVNGPLGGRLKSIHKDPSEKQEDESLLPETSMRFLESSTLQETIDHYRSFRFKKHYQNILNGLISQLESWKEQKESDKVDMAAISPAEENEQYYKNGLFEQVSHVIDKEQIHARLEAVAARLVEEDGDAFEFYKQLYFSPPDVIIDHCRNHNTEELFDIFQLNRQQI